MNASPAARVDDLEAVPQERDAAPTSLIETASDSPSHTAPREADAVPVSVTVPTRRLSRQLAGCCIGMMALCAAWAIWPQAKTTSTQPKSISTMVASTERARPLDLAAFQAPLWVAPIPPPTPPPPPPPPPPLKLQLIAITSSARDGQGELAALIYDPDLSKLFTLTAGQVIGGRTIVRVTESSVELRSSAGSQQLSLRASGTPARESVGTNTSPVEANP